MPDASQVQPVAFNCRGGLVLNRSTFLMEAGEALELVNFEPDIEGGYRRINGFVKYNTNVVPQTSASTEEVLLSCIFNGTIIAARGEKIFSAAAGSGSWTERDTGRTSAGVYTFERFNFDGNNKLIVADGANAPTVFNTSFAATDVSESSVSGSKFLAAFKNHMFYAGKSSTPQTVVFSQPNDEDAFNTGSGAGSIKVDDTITGLKVFRDNLFIFCQDRIFKLSGSTSSDFAITPVTRNIGCVNGQTIQEFAGDLIFLAPDGLRTVAGTARIGDVELGTISTPVQSLFNDNIANASGFRSIVIPNKTQYRVFFTKSGVAQTVTEGVITSLRGDSFEFANLKGIRPTSTDTVTSATETIIIHGGEGGYVYRQESGNDFDGTAINGKYRSPDLTFNDAGIRKHMQRVLVSFKPESSIDADLFLRYDFEDPDAPRPAAYSLDAADIVAIYGTGTYGTATYGGQAEPLLRQSVEGSGFTVALRVEDGGVTAPYSLKGFQLEYQLGARR
tara:strand:+ start:1301 stop:2812 length:1512 start_codon:yes stop_codon:yes gene_type:complete